MADEIKTTLRLDSVSDDKGISKAIAGIKKLETQVAQLRERASQLGKLKTDGLERAMEKNAKSVEKVNSALKPTNKRVEELTKQFQGFVDSGKNVSNMVGGVTRKISEMGGALKGQKNITKEVASGYVDIIAKAKAWHNVATAAGNEQLEIANKIKLLEAEISDRRVKNAASEAKAAKKAQEAEAARAAAKAKSDEVAARHQDKLHIASVNAKTREARLDLDAQTEARRSENKTNQALRRQIEAATQYQRQHNTLAASQDRILGLADKAAQRMQFRGDIERKIGVEAIKNLREQATLAGSVYRQKLNQYSTTSAQDKQARFYALDHYRREMALIKDQFQLKMNLGAEEQRVFNRDMRERERAHKDLQRQRDQGFSDAKSGASRFMQEARKPAMVAAAVAAATGAAAAKGISSRMNADTAETNLRIFGDDNGKRFTKETVAALRSGWLDALSIETGNDAASGLRAFTELNKQGIKDAKGNTELLLRATTGLELDRGETTKLLGLLDRNLGAKSSPARMHSALDAIAVAAKDDPSQANEIVEGMKRGFGAMSRGNMTPEQLTSLVSGGQSVGIQPGKAGTFIDALTQELAEGGYARGQRKKDLNKAAQMFGFGSARNMAHASATNSYDTIIRILDRLDRMKPEQRAKATALLSQRQWSGEDLQMLQGLAGMKATYADIQKDIAKRPEDRFLETAYREKVGSLEMQWRRTKAIVSRFWEAFGVGFEDIYREINAFFFNRTKSFNWLSISDAVKGFLKGFINGLGFDNITALLEYVFGKPSDAKSYISTLTEFGRGLGEGLRSIFGPIKALLAVFGATSPAILGKITGELVALSIALIALSPLVGAIGAVVGLLTAVKGFIAGLQAMGLLKGANPGGPGTPGGVRPPMGPPSSSPFFSRMFSGLGTYLPAFMMPLTIDEGKESKDRTMRRLGDYAKEHMGDLPPQPDISREGTQKVIDDLNKRIEELNSTVQQNTVIQKQSFDQSQKLGSLIRPASYSSGSSSDIQSLGARVQLAALGGSGSAFGRVSGGGGGGGGSASAAGITYTPGAGGAALYGSRPGSKLPNFGSVQQFGSDSASPDQKSGGSRSWRNNNPGNIEYGAFARSMGAIGSDGRFAKFPSYEAGRKAQEKLLFESNSYKDLTLSQAIRRWAPASENNVPAYIAAMHADPSMRMSQFSPEQRSRLLDAMQAHEGWRPGTVAGGGGSGASMPGGNPVDVASKFLGMGEHNAGRSQIEGFVGHNIAGAANAWCARFVNASLNAVGKQGSGSAVANSFLNWGKAITADMVQKGDVLVEHRGRGAGATGGHVGLATGNTRIGRNGQLQLEMLAGNSNDEVQKTWENASKVAVRRANETLAGKPGTYGGVQDVGDGIKGRPFQSGADLAKTSPAEALAKKAPPPIGGGAGRGGGTQVHAPITIHNNGDAEHTANQVQRRIADARNYVTHDVSWDSA